MLIKQFVILIVIFAHKLHIGVQNKKNEFVKFYRKFIYFTSYTLQLKRLKT